MKPINVTLFGKKIFAGVIELMILRWRDWSGLSRWVLNAITSERQREMQTEEEKAISP